jgi:chromosome segregation ATPase
MHCVGSGALRSPFASSPNTPGGVTASSTQPSEPAKLQYVRTWLKEVLDSDEVPPFEINSQTVDVLFELALFNRQREADVALLIEDANEKAAGFNKKADQMEATLSAIGLTSVTLPLSCKKSLACLSSLALTLDTKDTNLASFYLSLQDLDEELQGVAKEREEQNAEFSALLQKTRLAVARLDRMTKTLQKCKEEAEHRKEVMSQKRAEVRYLQGQSAEYLAKIQKLKEEIKASGATNEITHSALVKLSKEWQGLHEKTESLQENLNKYHQLPPDVNMATRKILEARIELAHLNQQINDALARMNISYH